MTTMTPRRNDTRRAVHELLLHGARTRTIQHELGITKAMIAKHLRNLRGEGLVVEPQQSQELPAGLTRLTDTWSSGPVLVEFRHGSVTGLVTAVAVPKVILPFERGLPGHADWLLVVVGPDVDDVRSWVHMRGQRISERQVAARLAGTRLTAAARLIASGLAYATGLEIIVEETPSVDD